MRSNLQFDFLVDKENNTLTIVRDFNAERQLVWNCYTKQELLDQWFSPKPLITRTKSMDFRNGGHWHYAMIEPERTEYWGYTSFHDINPIDYYHTFDAFCDSDGTINQELPTANWKVTFIDQGENTMVTTVVTYNSLNDLETVINMGMKDGMLSTLEKLDELLNKLTK
jgi:uncharacterized protein YndB with AHSA1/START domain